EACALIDTPAAGLPELLVHAGELRDRGRGRTVTFSAKVFVPLTTLCRDYCGYCTFRRDPGEPGAHTMEPNEVVALAQAGGRLGARGMAHDRAPDKVPARRLRTIALAGKLGIPFTTGLLIGIGETRRERVDTLVAIRDLHEKHGHIQEVIVQNFRAKPRIPMRDAPEPSLQDLLWTLAVAR